MARRAQGRPRPRGRTHMSRSPHHSLATMRRPVGSSSCPAPEEHSFEARLALVEREVARLREELVIARTDAGAARVLAAGADHDAA
jgi:hypothetical protein